MVGIGAFASVAPVMALPFNGDMVHSKNNTTGEHMYYSTGQLMREKAQDSVAVGEAGIHPESPDAAEKLSNPVKADEKSQMFGKRLFQINCSPCHGNIELNPYTPGPVASKLGKIPPDLSQEPRLLGVTDGYIYGVIDYGRGIMAAVGWKLSPTEHWDLINYVRHVQSLKAKR